MKIGIYALARNEAANVPRWEASSREADVRVVTDTGSTDQTVALLEAAGVTVARGAVVPWRWDDAHNLSLNNLPATVDVAVRLDLDEELAPGWREALEAAWKPGTTGLRYWYQWSAAVRFQSDRIHSRSGYRWTGATHEGLVRWAGEERREFADGLEIRHHREPGKTHPTDLTLLTRAVAEAPHDARMKWYLARELGYQSRPEAAAAFRDYLATPGGTATERAYACRVLAELEPDRRTDHLAAATFESPAEPDAYFELARHSLELGDLVATLYHARRAAACHPERQTHASNPHAYSPAPASLAYTAALRLGLHHEALAHAKTARDRAPNDPRLAAIVHYLETHLTREGPRAY